MKNFVDLLVKYLLLHSGREVDDLNEYVKTWANIYPYNSEKKNEFIKKGMAAYRAKGPHMEKFPKDVITAEVKMGGNPNILSEPMFLPEKKRSYAEFFGTPSPKSKGNKDKKRSSTGKSSSQKRAAHITHRRFLGVDDYRAYICIQYPGKDRTPGDREDDEVLRINREPEQEFNCHLCSFTTRRLEVMVLHTKSHIQGVYVSSPRKTKHSSTKRRKDKAKKSRGSDDAMESDSSSSDSDYAKEKKRKRGSYVKGSGGARGRPKKVTQPPEEPKTSSAIRSELLAVWDDSDEDEEFEMSLNRSMENEKDLSLSITDIILGKRPASETQKETETTIEAESETTDADTTLDKTLDQPGPSGQQGSSQKAQLEPEIVDETPPKDDSLNKSEEVSQLTDEPLNIIKSPSRDSDQPGDSKQPTESLPGKSLEDVASPENTTELSDEDTSKSAQKMNKDIQEAIKSCFDFDEDEEDDSALLGKTAAGRKIPRVIPPAERRKSEDTPPGEDVDREKILKESEGLSRKDEEARDEDVDATFKELMEMTAVPELPDIQNTLKCEQNFHNIKTIKFPDKDSVDPSLKEASIDPSSKEDIIDPSSKEDIIDTSSKEDIIETSSKEDIIEPSLKEDIIEPSLKESIIEPSLKESIIEPSLKEDIIEPSSKEDIIGPLNQDVDALNRDITPKSDEMGSSKSDAASPSKPDVIGLPKPEVLSPFKPEVTGSSKPDTVSVSRPEKKDPSDSATKLINPKKRFVKSFEDFELMQNEIRRKEEEAKSETVVSATTEESKSISKPGLGKILVEQMLQTACEEVEEEEKDVDDINLCRLKSKIMSRIIEEAKIGDEQKTKIMSKMSDSPAAKAEESKKNNSEEVKTSVHRTPRSKILELYRNDKQKLEEQKSDKSQNLDSPLQGKEKFDVLLKETSSRNEAVPPKKGKWSRRGSHPKKDRNAFLIEEALVDDVSPKQAEKDQIVQSVAVETMQGPADVMDSLAKVNETVLDTLKERNDKENEAKDVPLEEAIREFTAEGVNDEQMKIDDKYGTIEVGESKKPIEEVANEVNKLEEMGFIEDLAPKEPVIETAAPEETLPTELEISTPTESKQIESVPLNEIPPVIEGDIQKESEAENPPSHEIIEGEKEDTTKDISIRDEAKDVQITSGAENVIDEKLSVVTDSVLPSDHTDDSHKAAVAEASESTPAVQNEESQEINEKPRPPSPAIDVVSSPVPDPPKDAICSPPKKSKKRKLSDGLPTVDAENVTAPTSELDVASLSPAEKKKKETDDDKPRESLPVLAKLETDSVDAFREHKSDINDMETIKGDASTPKPPEGHPAEHTNELEIRCGASSPESFKFSIQTNLSNLTSREEISALALATLSEIKADLDACDSNMSEEKQETVEKAVLPPAPTIPELVPIEGNLTVVSERDLADGQVEITSEQVFSPKKPVTLSTFSMDFLDSASEGNSTSEVDFSKCTEFSGRGTEFTSKAMTKQLRKADRKKENAYERLELLSILEGNSDSEKKAKEALPAPKPKKSSAMDDICDFEEHIPSQIVCAKQLNRDSSVDREYPYTEKSKTGEKSTTSKLLERLTVSASKAEGKKAVGRGTAKTPINLKISKQAAKIKTPTTAANKPIILSEQIVKPATDTSKSKSKKTLDDIEDVEAFVIHKDPKRILEHEGADPTHSSRTSGKAKILQQTIITPAGEIIQPTVNQAQTDDNIFDINSMPIVLSDEILTPESIENMPIILGSDQKPVVEEKSTPRRAIQGRIISKTTTVTIPQPVPAKNQIVVKQSKTPRILQSAASKAIKTSPLLPSTTKPGKYIILPQSGVQSAKYITTKKSPVVKKPNIVPKSTAVTPEPSGNKIMIVTNQQGQQQRLLLTPAQQKMLGYQNQKVTKTLVKGNVMQKSVLATKSVPMIEPGTSGVMSKGPSLVGQKIIVGASPGSGLLSTTSTPEMMPSQGRLVKAVTRKSHLLNQKPLSGTNKTQKTILIKNQHGQTVRKIQGTDDELLDKQVAEQLEAIKASSGIKFSSQVKPIESPPKVKMTARRSYSKKVEPKVKTAPPPLATMQQPLKEPTLTKATLSAPKKPESKEVKSILEEAKPTQDRPLNQLVIQDAVGNQTTITEGQILALPSETVDGQPQSYMLVTLDESGNLTPLNSEALMSLDPNLGLGGDLSNMVLQIDQGALTERPQSMAVKATVSSEPPKAVEPEPAPVPVPEPLVTAEIAKTVEHKAPVPSTNGEPGQQLIVTGDPIATQKFLDSLTEGTTDLANILANAEGNSILIQADGQQILINTNSDSQMLLSMSNDGANARESTEGGGNPVFATQPSKSQDILAAALADTDVFQPDQHHSAPSKITSQLSPGNTLYPMNVSNVLETSLTLSSPIMTPLEVPSINTKKIPDEEADMLTRLPKNMDLPITITDPNIAQTVANQQVASLMAAELQANLELGLATSDAVISSVTGMNSPSYVYSLPTLDDSVDINQKPFNSSMPLLNEDIEEAAVKPKELEKEKDDDKHETGSSYLDEEEGRFTLGGEMCSSLSEPPPEMFDLPEDNQSLLGKRNSNIPSSLQSTPDVSDNASKDGDLTDLSTHAGSSNEDSCEIPLQPQIVAKSSDLSENLGSPKRSVQDDEGENKRCKFD